MELTVSKLGAEVGLTADTIRYYEKAGLLPTPDRTSTGYRVHDEGAVERLRFIKGAQRLGLRLQVIKKLLDIRDRGLCPCGHTESLLDRRMSELDAEIRSWRTSSGTSSRSGAGSRRSIARTVLNRGLARRSS